MEPVKEFLSRHKFTLLALVFVLVFGALYMNERAKPAAVWQAQPTKAATVPGLLNEDSSETGGAMSDSIKVYIVGAVKSPGVYELEKDARVEDALALAGGATDEADLLKVNLAAKLTDAQRVIIPAVGSDEALYALPGEEDADAPVNINTATAAQLETLPGIGPVLAEGIIAYRTEHGAFETVEAIKDVSRIGDAIFGNIKDRITVGS